MDAALWILLILILVAIFKFLKWLLGAVDTEDAEQAVAPRSPDPDEFADPDAWEIPARSATTIYRSEYVPKEDEAEYLTRDDNGLPIVKLVYAGDRLVIWSPVNGGGMINPKGPGIRHFGFVGTYARGHDHYEAAFRAAELSAGSPVELLPQPDNPHDKNAIALVAPGSLDPFGYVQRGERQAL
ncbi:MAG: HIRAN domain-containing protein [Nocardioidaceae bacterium]|nr:MAG: HIRAN domain-containing protein [Nocardioidaceae bacterium]